MANSIPKLFDVLRPTLADIAAWAGATRALADVWRSGSYAPKPPQRAALVRAVRRHASQLLILAERVEREGHRDRQR